MEEFPAHETPGSVRTLFNTTPILIYILNFCLILSITSQVKRILYNDI